MCLGMCLLLQIQHYENLTIQELCNITFSMQFSCVSLSFFNSQNGTSTDGGGGGTRRGGGR